MTRVLQNFDANLKRLLWNGFKLADSHWILKPVYVYLSVCMYIHKGYSTAQSPIPINILH